jgi:hypothetical protein
LEGGGGGYFDKAGDLISEIREIKASLEEVGVGTRAGRGNRRRRDAANTRTTVSFHEREKKKETTGKGIWGKGGLYDKKKEICDRKYH